MIPTCILQKMRSGIRAAGVVCALQAGIYAEEAAPAKPVEAVKPVETLTAEQLESFKVLVVELQWKDGEPLQAVIHSLVEMGEPIMPQLTKYRQLATDERYRERLRNLMRRIHLQCSCVEECGRG